MMSAHLGEQLAHVELGGQAHHGDAHSVLASRLDAGQYVTRVHRGQRAQQHHHLRRTTSDSACITAAGETQRAACSCAWMCGDEGWRQAMWTRRRAEIMCCP